jgi:hypothetical protein
MNDHAIRRFTLAVLDFPWWELFAFVRGVSLAALVALEFVDMRENPTNWPWESLRFVLLLLAILLSAAFGAFETLWSLGRALLIATTRDHATGQVVRNLAAAPVRAACAVLPLVVLFGGQSLGVPDRIYIWRHQRQLDAVLRGADAESNGFMGAQHDGTRTVIQASNLSISDCYWLIYDEREPTTEELFADDSLSFPRHGARPWHVFGPWYALVE